MTLPPLQTCAKPPLQESALWLPPCIPQYVGESVGAMISKLAGCPTPYSLVKKPGARGP